MAASGTADTVASPRHAAAVDSAENEADGHDSQKKKSAFQITSVIVKKYSEEDNQRHPRSMDDLDMDGDRNDHSVYSTEPGYESFDNGLPQQLPPPPHDQSSAGGTTPFHHAAALSSTAVIRSFSHALDPKGSRFVVVKVESKDPYARGRWKCMDYQDESDRGDMSIVVRSADSSGSSRASSVNYQHGVDDAVRNPLLHNIPEGSATPPAAPAAAGKLPPVAEQHQAPQAGATAVPSGDGGAGTGGGAAHQHHHGHAGGSVNPDLMLKTAFTGYPPGTAMLPSAALLLAPAATAAMQPHTVAERNHGNLPSGQPKPAPPGAATAAAGPSLFSSAVANARTPTEGLVSLAAGAGAQPLHEVYPITAAAIAAAVAGSVPAMDAELVVPDGRPSPSLPTGVSLPALLLQQQQQQIVQQPKSAVVIVKPEPVRSTPVSTHLAMTLGETLGLQVLDGPSASSDAQIRDTDATTTGVAIDNKIEQAMDLVKSHLMFAVREEVEDLRQKIKDLVDEKNRLEYENTVLRTALSADMLAKLLPPASAPLSSAIVKPSQPSQSST